ncbi:MAG: hypothetical protein L6266_00755 [Nanoarchaeota archaeon]|nr:hypothetical protein [Nanoarchaeota archaeon]
MKKLIFSIIFLILIALANAQEEITKEKALESLENAKQDMTTMNNEGFTVIFINDTIIEAESALERVENALDLNYSGFSYEEVLEILKIITERKAKAYEISDKLRALELKAENYASTSVDVTKSLVILENAKNTFNDERYESVESLIIDLENSLETAKAERTLGNVVANSTKNFIQKNYLQLIILLAVIIVITIISWNRIKKIRAKNKLTTFKIEKESIKELMKETQREFYQRENISKLTYGIRMDLYREKLTELNHTIPVFEAIVKGEKIKKNNNSSVEKDSKKQKM